MSTLLYILLAAVLTTAVSVLSGKVLLRWAGLVLTGSEEFVLGGILGSGCLAGLAFVLTLAGLGRRGVFVVSALVVIAVCTWCLRRVGHKPVVTERQPTIPFAWAASFALVYVLFGGMYLVVALAPEASADGAGYHLGRVAGWLRSFSFRSDFGAALPDGMESLFLFASAIGHHTAATVVEWMYLMGLPLALLLYARRVGVPRAGAAAALLMFLSPIAARTGTIASGDVAIACVAFACFWLVQLPGKSVRKTALAIGLGLYLIWIVAPLLEREAHKTLLETNVFAHTWPLEVFVHGSPLVKGLSGGFVGPLFLLAPLALFSLGSTAGRRLLACAAGLAALTLAVVPLDHVEARTLIPLLPFVALALTIALSEWRGALPMTAVAAVIMGWPAVTYLYSDDAAWRFPRIHTAEWQAAFRVQPEDEYLRKYLRGYHTGSMLADRVAPGGIVLALSPFPAAYHSLHVLDASDESTVEEGKRLNEIISGAVLAEGHPSTAARAMREARVDWVLIDKDDVRAHWIFQRAAEFGLEVRWIVEDIEVFKVN